uniref:(California timema) hypothetical protein n=1 Tax=Timema californicum TaxID=61474 RepID=A0A7R9IWG9_TIMCA|nr:unnamed protein product [Timema californicum]
MKKAAISKRAEHQTDAATTSMDVGEVVKSATRRALYWLSQQRHDDWGWGGDTARAILTFVLIDSSWFNRQNLESQLATKQMELEIVLQLWRHHELPITSASLAHYSLALNAICQDPRQFHSHDLIGTLQHHEPELDVVFALSNLAVCSSGAHVRKRQIRRLLDISDNVKDHNVDTLSMVVMALQCIVHDHRNRNLEHYVKRASHGLMDRQQQDGSFGNLHTTALAIQALQAARPLSSEATWNESAALNYLESRQADDGSWGDIQTTSDVILALGSNGLCAVRDMPCPNRVANVMPTSPPFAVPGVNLTQHSSESELPEQAPGPVTVTYTLWVGTNITENYSITVSPEHNATFYNVMQIAAEQDSHYQFSATEWPNGHYVHTIAGYKEEPTYYHYWLLYRLAKLPDPAYPPGNNFITPVGSSNPSWLCPSSVATHVTCARGNLETDDPVPSISPVITRNLGKPLRHGKLSRWEELSPLSISPGLSRRGVNPSEEVGRLTSGITHTTFQPEFPSGNPMEVA